LFRHIPLSFSFTPSSLLNHHQPALQPLETENLKLETLLLTAWDTLGHTGAA
jgi:hypothetical protein